MDKIDREIVTVMMRDARITYRELGEKVCLSANAVGERVKALLASRVIQRFGAKVDYAALGLPLQAYVDVKLKPDAAAFRFEAAIQAIRGVVGATLLTGAHDYTLRIACHDQADFVRVMETIRAVTYVQETQTRLILKDLDLSL